MSRDKVLLGPEYFECEKLSARISARQCLLNQGKADGLRAAGTRFIGRVAVCLDCQEGKSVTAWPPGSVPGARSPEPGARSPEQVPSPQPSPLGEGERVEVGWPGQPAGDKPSSFPDPGGKPALNDSQIPKKPRKLPAWLKNASAAVRRDYLRERG